MRVARAELWTGRAFLLALMNRLLTHAPSAGRRLNQPRALILAPTRELAVQIHKDAVALGAHIADARTLTRDDLPFEFMMNALRLNEGVPAALFEERGFGSAASLSLSRSSLPVLKNGTNFSDTDTDAPVRGLRPCRAARCLTVNAPKPRNSTRSPRANASTISSKMTFTIRSTSRCSRASSRCEPMNPATPVMSHVRGSAASSWRRRE